MTVGLAAATGVVLPELRRLLATAAQEIDRHVNSGGTCVICRARFPCERAVLADLALAAL